MALDDARSGRSRLCERKSHVVEMRFFGRLTHGNRRRFGISAKTVMREWQVAKVWLLRELSGGSLSSARATGR